MRKVSQKVVFCVLVVLTLNVCVIEPMSLNVFLEDPKVQEIIDKGVARVNITPDSDLEGLTAGNGKITITGLPKYYMIEEFDENSVPMNVQFVSANATRTENLTGIGKVSNGEITELNNSNWYRVKWAKPLAGQAAIFDLSANPTTGSGTPTTISGGALTLQQPTNNYYLDLPTVISAGNSDIVKIPISPGGLNQTTIKPVSGNIIKLEGQGTVTDYVFAGKDASGNITHEKFYVLTVTVNSPANVNVTNVTFNISDHTLQMTGNTTISKTTLLSNAGHSLTVNLNGATFVKWTIGEKDFIVNPLALKYGMTQNIDDILVKGKLDITLVVTVDGKTYSNVFTVTIND